MKRVPRRRMAVPIAVLALCGGAVLAGAWVHAGRRLDEQRASLAEQVARERARLAAIRLPCLGGEPVESSAPKAIDELDARAASIDVLAVGIPHGFAVGSPLPAKCATELERHRDLVGALKDTLRRTRIEPPSFGPRPGLEVRLIHLRSLATLAVLEGHEHAARGEREAAADSYLLAVRLGVEAGRQGRSSENPLLGAVIGISLQALGLRPLGELVASGPALPPAALARLAEQLAALEAVHSQAPEVVRAECLVGLANLLERGDFPDDSLWGSPRGQPASQASGSPPASDPSGALRPVEPWAVVATRALVPRRILLETGIAEYDLLLREVERAAAQGDRAEEEKVAALLAARSSASWNPVVRSLGSFTVVNFCKQFDRLAALYAVDRAAIRVETLRDQDGRFPGGTGVELPPDPCSPAHDRLHYLPSMDRRAWRVWSVGENGRDDGGVTNARGDLDDIVVERRAK